MRTYLPTLLIILLYSTTLFGQVERPQIWDFGAVSFDRTRFENMLTSGEINSWMSDKRVYLRLLGLKEREYIVQRSWYTITSSAHHEH